MPTTISVCCPRCDHHAEFTFSKAQSIKKKDRDYFTRSRNFKTEKVEYWDGSRDFVAWNDPGLGNNIDVISDLPANFESTDFKHNNRGFFYYRRTYERGVTVCKKCDFRRLVKLKWPEMSFYKVEYKNHMLWAYNREHALMIRDYLKDPKRQKRIVSTRGLISQKAWLRKIPTVFQTKKATPHVIKKLEKLIS